MYSWFYELGTFCLMGWVGLDHLFPVFFAYPAIKDPVPLYCDSVTGISQIVNFLLCATERCSSIPAGKSVF